ncbi:MAG: DNA-deoxyinosine glycosylase [marine bacterium B5-7]|nr:MAG: DNA-deoxyinosine glycosylase [marine bacterium B5-7]
MSTNHGFPPIAAPDARILILGSMPGKRSLEKHQYYAYPQNCFWQIMSDLLNIKPGLNYPQRKKYLKLNHIAVWDVLASCDREGSLDSNIDLSSARPNDFDIFFASHKHIRTVFFNGATAERFFKRFISINQKSVQLTQIRLPSTSPAHASMTVQEKLKKWSVIKSYL